MGDALSAEDLAALGKVGNIAMPLAPPAPLAAPLASPPREVIDDPDAGEDPDATPTALATAQPTVVDFGAPTGEDDPDDEGPALGSALDALETSIDEFDEAVEAQWKPRRPQSDDDPVEHSWTAPKWVKRLRTVIGNVEDSILAMEKLVPDEGNDAGDDGATDAAGEDVGSAPDGEFEPAAAQRAQQAPATQPTQGAGLTLDEGITLQQLCMNLAALHHIIAVAQRKEFQRCIRNLPQQLRQAFEATLAASPQFIEAGTAIVQMRSGVSLDAARAHTEAMLREAGMQPPDADAGHDNPTPAAEQ